MALRDYKRKKTDQLYMVMISCGMVWFLIKMIMTQMLGLEGAAFIAPAILLFEVGVFVCGYSLNRAVAVMVKYRVRRGRYRNALRIGRVSLLFGFALGIVLAGLFMLLAGKVTTVYVGEPMAYIPYLVMAPVFVLVIVAWSSKGYIQGYGNSAISSISLVIQIAAMFVLTILMGNVFGSYGEKVSGLLKNESYASVYRAIGIVGGILISLGIDMLYVLLMRFIFNKSNEMNLYDDTSRFAEGSAQIIASLIQSLLQNAFLYLFYMLIPVAAQIIAYRVINKQEDTNAIALQYGIWIGCFMPLIMLLFFAGVFILRHRVLDTYHAKEQEMMRTAREKCGNCFQIAFAYGAPASVLCIGMSEGLADIFHIVDEAQVVILQSGGVILLLALVHYVELELLIRIRLNRMIYVISGVEFAVFTLLSVLLGKTSGASIAMINVAMIIALLLGAFALYIMVERYIGAAIDLKKTIVMPLIASGVSGLIVYLLSKALVSLIGGWIYMVIGLVIGIAAYMFLLIFLRGIEEEDVDLYLLKDLISMIQR